MDLVPLQLEDAPAHFFAALTQSAQGEPQFLGAGRGLTARQARLSCLGEAAETMRARSADAVPVLTLDDIAKRPHIKPNALWCFSQQQLRGRPHASETIDHDRWRMIRATTRHCRQWCAAEDASGAVMLAPATNVLLSPDLPLTSSNGLAAGTSRQSATDAAILELVERDAVAVWWYGRIKRPAVPLEHLDLAGAGDLRRWLQTRRRRTWILDVTHDLGIPVMVAVSSTKSGKGIAYAAAARTDPHEAALSAVLELLQAEISLQLAAARARLTGAADGPAGRFWQWSEASSVKALDFLRPGRKLQATPVSPEPHETVRQSLQQLVRERAGLPVYTVYLGQQDGKYHVVRALAPGLRPWQPRFAAGRLTSVPRQLNWTFVRANPERVEQDVILI